MTPRPCEWCGESFLGRKRGKRCEACKESPPKCTTPWCAHPRRRSQLCGRCYAQTWKGGEVHLTCHDLSIKDRLFKKRLISDSGCWLWTGHVDTPGYGTIDVEGSKYKTHRLAFSLWNGDIPPGEHIHHKCAVRNCFNPEHLEAITQTANNGEMLARRSYEQRIAFLEARVLELEQRLGDQDACLPLVR